MKVGICPYCGATVYTSDCIDSKHGEWVCPGCENSLSYDEIKGEIRYEY